MRAIPSPIADLRALVIRCPCSGVRTRVVR